MVYYQRVLILNNVSGKGSHDSLLSFGGPSFAGHEHLNQDLINKKLQDLYQMNLSDLLDSTTTTLLQNSGILLKIHEPMGCMQHLLF